MSMVVDQKYASLLSNRLDRFQKKSDDLWNFRCPICGDSQRNKHKARGYIYRKKDRLNFKCHNCSLGMSFGNFLRQMDGGLYNQYKLEKFGDRRPAPTVKPVYSKPAAIKNLVLENAELLSTLDYNHPGRRYITNRCLPDKALDILYYVDDYRGFVDSFTDSEKAPEGPRIVIPFIDSDGVLVGVQGRSILPEEKIRFVTTRINPGMFVFGLDRVDESKPLFLFEGPFDSLFVDNGISLAGLSHTIPSLPLSTRMVFDNQPRNKDVVKLTKRIARKGFYVCVWPRDFLWKDVNEMVQRGGFDGSEVQEFLENNVYNGLEAMMRLDLWAKV